MQNVAANRTVLLDSSALRRSPRLSSADMEIVGSERNASVVVADTARLRRSPRLANGYAEVAVSKVRTFLKRKRSPRNQNGRLDVQFALVQVSFLFCTLFSLLFFFLLLWIAYLCLLQC
jgi:DNA (cytosine-5)-methyltransferase 1